MIKKDSYKLNNKSVACFNIAMACLLSDDMTGVLRELYELEVFITPEMNVYKNLIESGFDQMLFRPRFLNHLVVIEEIICRVAYGKEVFDLTPEKCKGR